MPLVRLDEGGELPMAFQATITITADKPGWPFP
jgi:hypothetical protein